jgi:hypothetical protein
MPTFKNVLLRTVLFCGNAMPIGLSPIVFSDTTFPDTTLFGALHRNDMAVSL